MDGNVGVDDMLTITKEADLFDESSSPRSTLIQGSYESWTKGFRRGTVSYFCPGVPMRRTRHLCWRSDGEKYQQLTGTVSITRSFFWRRDDGVAICNGPLGNSVLLTLALVRSERTTAMHR